MMQSATAQDDQNDQFMSDELPPGTTLLHKQYTIEKFLSSGGFGITYLARDSLNRRVVIKECFPHALCRRAGMTVVARTRSRKDELASIVRQFVREAWALSKLKHPNILSVHQIFEGNETAYMVVDYVDGFDLSQAIEDPKLRLSPQNVDQILRKLLSAISLIHDQDMLHRDISPDNILIDRETLNPFLIDFGAAREGVSQTGRALSEVRVVKDGYSPEEFYANGSQGPYSDLYALAATFYHVIRGEAPPISQSRLFAVATQQSDPYAPLDLSLDGYKPSFIAAINQSLQVLPRDRLQSAREWLEMIGPDDDAESDSAPASEPGGDAPTAQSRRVPSRPLKPMAVAPAEPQKSSKTPILAAVAAVALLGGAAVMFGLPSATESSSTVAEPKVAAVAQGESQPDATAPTTAAGATDEPAPAVVEPVSGAAGPDEAVAAPAIVLPEGVELIAPAPSAPAETTAADAPDGSPETTAAAASPSAPEGLVLPEGVELIAPAPTNDETQLAAADEAAVPDTATDTPSLADPAALDLPEGVELIAPASPETAAAAPEPTTVSDGPQPEAEGSPATSSTSAEDLATDALVIDTPLSTELALNAVTGSDGVLLPFFHDGTDTTRIAGLLAGAEDWMSVGLRIVEVNGDPIQSFDDIPGLLKEKLSAATASGATTLPVAFGIEPFAGAEILRKPLSLTIVPQLSVAGKITAQILTKDDQTYAVVTAIAPGVETELKVGDRLVAYMAAEGQVDIEDNLGTVLMQQIALGNRTLNFMVERDGAIWLAALKLDLDE